MGAPTVRAQALIVVLCLASSPALAISPLTPRPAERPAPSSVPLKTEVDHDAWVSDLEAFIPELMARAKVPGLSIAVIRDSRVAWTEGFGVKSVETNVAVSETTVFQAASLSKPVFAYAVLKLVEQGRLDLDRPLADYVPFSYLTTDERADDITARIVLSHTTGFPNWRKGGLKLHFTPGERFSYSGEGYVYLQQVVEEVTGQSLDRLMREQVFTPLGMTHSSYVWRESFRSNHAVGHGGSAKVKYRSPTMHANAAASLYTTAADFARFLVAMLQGTGLRESSLDEMLEPQVRLADCLNCTRREASPSELSARNAWGLGWGLQTTGEGTSFWHWGDNDVYKAYTVTFRDQGIGLVYFANSVNGLAIRDELVRRAIGGRHPAFGWLGYEQR